MNYSKSTKVLKLKFGGTNKNKLIHPLYRFYCVIFSCSKHKSLFIVFLFQGEPGIPGLHGFRGVQGMMVRIISFIFFIPVI